MVKHYNYMENQEVLNKIKSGPEYRKKELTDLRLVADEEDTKQHITYVLDKSSLSINIETCSSFSKDVVVARNRKSIGKDGKDNLIYNEWLIPVATAKKNYGEETYKKLTTEFVGYLKKTTVRAIPICPELFEQFQQWGCVDKYNGIHLSISWGSGEMIVRPGDFLTDAGYAISAKDMETYELTPGLQQEITTPPHEVKRFFKEAMKILDEPGQNALTNAPDSPESPVGVTAPSDILRMERSG